MSDAACGDKRKLGSRTELQLLIAKATDLFVIGCPPRRIAPQVDRCEQTVKRWMAKRKITPPSVETQELYEANLIKDEVWETHQSFPDVEGIASRLETPAHIVRAALYLAMKERESTQTETQQEQAQ